MVIITELITTVAMTVIMDYVFVSCDITKNRGRQCPNKLGGLDLIYIFPFVKYAKSLIVRDGLVLTSYPNTFVYSFAIVGGEYSESSSVEDGGDLVEQSLTATMTNLNEDNEWQKLVKKDHCVIAKDRNGKYRLMGAYSGVETEYKATTGSGHADFNGWTFNFKSREQQQALYFEDLNGVGLIDSGFTPIGETIDFIFQDGDSFIFQDNNNFIFN